MKFTKLAAGLISAVLVLSVFAGCLHKNKISDTVKPSAPKTYAVTVSAVENGNIEVIAGSKVLSGEELKNIAENTGITVTLTANNGFIAKSLSVNGSPAGILSGDKKSISHSLNITGNLEISGKTEAEQVNDEYMVSVPVPSGYIQGHNHTGTLASTVSWRYGVFSAGREVKLSPYKIAKYELTYELWNEVRLWAKEHGYKFYSGGQKGGSVSAIPYVENKHDPQEPVTRVSWYDAIVWCNAYTEKTFNSTSQCVYLYGGMPIKDATLRQDCDKAEFHIEKKGYRLPTSAEWEFAARRQGDGSKPEDKINADSYGTGSGEVYLTRVDSLAGAKKPAAFNDPDTGALVYGNAEELIAEGLSVAVYGKYGVGDYLSHNTSVEGSDVVGGKEGKKRRANALGLFDMSGNAEEWVWDWMQKPDDAYLPPGSFENPVGADPSSDRVVRGGSFTHDMANCCVGRYHRYSPITCLHYLGFRIAQSVR